MAFEVEALLTQSKNENGKVRLNTVFLAVRIRLALLNLYVAISIEKIKETEVSRQGNTGNGVTQNPRSANNSIANNHEKINTRDMDFLCLATGAMQRVLYCLCLICFP